MEIKLSSAVIRPWRADDAEALERHANNRNIWLNLRDMFPHPYTIENAHGFLSFVAQEQPLATFAIATAAEAIGCIGLKMGEDVHRRTAELGYWLGEAFWGRGIMTEAVSAFTKFAFENYGLDRIHAEPFATNTGSARLLEKGGFVLEGRLRARVFKDGKVQDSLLYAKTRT